MRKLLWDTIPQEVRQDLKKEYKLKPTKIVQVVDNRIIDDGLDEKDLEVVPLEILEDLASIKVEIKNEISGSGEMLDNGEIVNTKLEVGENKVEEKKEEVLEEMIEQVVQETTKEVRPKPLNKTNEVLPEATELPGKISEKDIKQEIGFVSKSESVEIKEGDAVVVNNDGLVEPINEARSFCDQCDSKGKRHKKECPKSKKNEETKNNNSEQTTQTPV